MPSSAQPFDDRSGFAAAKLIAIYAYLGVANLAAWGLALWLFYDQPTLIGIAVLAYVLGMRHAVDADHIAAIDNVVRKLMQDGARPLSVGLFFALGHSTVVVLAVLAIAAGTAVLRDQVTSFKSVGGLIGTSVSALFLIGIGLFNVIILRNVWSAFRDARRGRRRPATPSEDAAAGFGPLSTLFRPLFRMITRSWHMYPLGFLFGLGFDTATEVTLLGLSAAQAAQGMPIWSILVLPLLFAAGMALIDTTDSVLMVGAYGWAFINPIRKLWYNLTITATSVAVAFFIGGVELLGLIRDKLGLQGAVWNAVADLNDNLANFGFVVVGLFIASWLVSFALYRWKGLDELPAMNEPSSAPRG